MNLQDSQQIPGANGHRLSVTQYGALEGTPVFFFHGAPGSRLPMPEEPATAHALGVRMIALDRPGYGHSQPQPHRTLCDWPQDVAAVADYLGIQGFAVIGQSAGGPHAVACAALLGGRVTALALVGAPAPPQADGAIQNLSRTALTLGALGRYLPRAARLGTGLSAQLARRAPERYMRFMESRLAPADAALLADSRFRQGLLDKYREGYRRGGGGHARDLYLLAHDWGFDLERVRCPTWLWHGAEDQVVPATVCHVLERCLPRAHCSVVPETGHLLFEREEGFRAILERLCRGHAEAATSETARGLR